jgi:acyl-CoA dehydrogenase
MTALAEASALASEVAARHAADVDLKARFPSEALAALRQHKLLSVLVPARDGGAGGRLGDVLSICYRLGRSCASTAMIFAMHQIQAACVVRHGAASDWHRAFLRRMADEQLLLASATTETGVGGDLRSSLCAVEERDGRFSLIKQASVISYGADSDAILATARRAPQSPASDQVLVVVPRGAGCRLDPKESWDTLGMRGTCSQGYVLEASGEIAQVLPASYGDISAQTMVPTSHLLWSGVWLGIATDAVARARAFVRAEVRKKSTSAGGLRLAETTSKLQLMRSNIESALRRYQAAMDQPDTLSSLPFGVTMNNLKVASSRTAVEIVGEALQICGLSGYRNDSPFSVARHLRDVQSAPLMVNNDRILANTAALLPALRQDPDLLT